MVFFNGIYGGDKGAGIGSGRWGTCNLSIYNGDFQNISSFGAGNNGICNILVDNLGVTGSIVTGSIISDGNILLIIIGAVLIVVGIIVFVLINKRKKQIA